MIETRVSKHGYKRIKERLGLNRKAANRHASLSFNKGILPENYHFKPVAKYYEERQKMDNSTMILFYKDLVHVFTVGTDSVPCLVTLYDPLTEKGFL